MLTDNAKPVDGAASSSAPPDGLWMTVSDLARQKGVSKQAIAKRVDRFARDGILSTRSGPRGAKLVNVAAYDKAANEAGDAIRELAQKPALPDIKDGDPILAREQARRVQYQADIAEIELAELRGQVLRTDDVVASMTRCAEALVRIIDRLPNSAEDLAAAASRDGVLGLRTELKRLAFEQRNLLAQEMRLLASGDPAGQEEPEE